MTCRATRPDDPNTQTDTDRQAPDETNEKGLSIAAIQTYAYNYRIQISKAAPVAGIIVGRLSMNSLVGLLNSLLVA